MRSSSEGLGVGIVYLPGLEEVIATGKDVFQVVEVEPQPFSTWTEGILTFRGDIAARLQTLPQEKLVHGVGAPVGGLTVDQATLAPYLEAIEVLAPPWASEHLTFNRIELSGATHFTAFMLPPLQVSEAVDVAARNIRMIQEAAGVPFAFETPVNYLQPRNVEMTEGQFFAAVAEQAECGILLDLYNVWCNEQNGRQTVAELIAELPLDRVWEVHLGDGRLVDGYWVDAHSGLVAEPIFELAADIIPRLPNAKAMIFEIMPEYMAAEGISPTQVVDQAERMHDVWELRGTAAQQDAVPGPNSSQATSGPPGIALQDWESSLGTLVAGRSPPPTAAVKSLSDDDGVTLYRHLASSVRRGMVADSLTLTSRYLFLTIGEEGFQDLLRRFWSQHYACTSAEEEAASFASWLGVNYQSEAESSAAELAHFEVARHLFQTTGRLSTLRFSQDPRTLLEALGQGRLPEEVIRGKYELEVT